MKNSTSTLKNEIDQIPFEKKIIFHYFVFLQNSEAFQFIEQQDCFQCSNPHFVTKPGGSLT